MRVIRLFDGYEYPKAIFDPDSLMPKQPRYFEIAEAERRKRQEAVDKLIKTPLTEVFHSVKEKSPYEAFVEELVKKQSGLRLFHIRNEKEELIRYQGVPLYFNSRRQAREIRNQLNTLFGLKTFITKGQEHSL